MKTLFDEVTDWMFHQQGKHGFDEDYPEQLVNQMSNWEMLKAISEYLEFEYKKVNSDEN